MISDVRRQNLLLRQGLHLREIRPVFLRLGWVRVIEVLLELRLGPDPAWGDRVDANAFRPALRIASEDAFGCAQSRVSCT